MLRELVSASIIYLGPLMVGVAPLLLLYWLYRPTVLMNPGLSALKAPATTALSLRPTQPKFREEVETSSHAALADATEGFDELEPAAKKPKSPTRSRGPHQILAHRSVRFAGSTGRPVSPHTTSAAVNSLGQYTGMSRSSASAYAYAVNQTGRWW